MNINGYVAAALFEHRFWLQVFGDHARFILNALSPDEREEAGRAQYFIAVFDGLLAEAGRTTGYDGVVALSRNARRCIEEIRAFKLHLLARSLRGHIKIKLPPTFLNHMVNEAEEALLVMDALARGAVPPVPDAAHLHLVWLQDAIGHAESIVSSLDMTERALIDESGRFATHFRHLYLKAVELAGYLRTNLLQFPAFSRFNRDVDWEMKLFVKFLLELEEMGLRAETLGTLAPLMPDHMAREECYYLTKLSLATVSEVQPPACDPGKPRVQA